MSEFRKKCCKCRRKKLIVEKCKCDFEYCLDCLPFFNHNCIFDWKKENQNNLLKLNPKIEAIKVVDI